MDSRTARFTERMGQIFEADGFPRIAGRLFGLLMLREEPASLNDLAATLGVSKASVSTNARLLASHGVIERATVPHDRRDYYQIIPNFFVHMMEERLGRWRAFADAMGEGRRTLPRHSPAVRRRLAEYASGYARVTHSIQTTLARWERTHPHTASTAVSR
jgi:DNA-binding transcriptional regulator GbsR (MarR family)